MSKLNVHAPEFVPGSWKAATNHFYYGSYYYKSDFALEEAVTSEELEELEACEEWVRTMADLDEMEREHLIATALSEAPPAKILEVEMRAMALDTSGHGSKRKPEAKRKGKH
ncbi:hypothetical protein PLESTB_001474200 [Pleodorina starrii]|uniref:Uncharacterized protein n=1 Tax=Pleodorina starrii TaxID=330485 RepID=A0A9W6F7M1_9CHLO|nr:hypothetical protein PLESTM_000645600 [Pleodorina starrii]GLC59323.1 hypothetical protein PLESTB_001474200 [Pleodorina starrii]GLC74478.1 hypothetical protein PLESTF_001517100 [Pleodorina starrii]